MGEFRFPEGFIWGVATASYQIEGAVTAGGRSSSIWDTFSRTPGRIVNGDTGDQACDHYHRYPEDVALMRDLGVGSYRFSMAWPRLQPEGRGGLNAAGADFYDRLLDELLGAGISPWVTLYHWDLPQLLEDRGGWPERDTALRFADYAVAVHERFGDRIGDWTTLNEPWCSSFLSYAAGQHAPGRTEPEAALRAAHHLMVGHGLAVGAMRDSRPGNRFGITLNLTPVVPASQSATDRDAARRVDGISHRIFLDPLLRGSYPRDVMADVSLISDFSFVAEDDLAQISTPMDFLGLNYYTQLDVAAGDLDLPEDAMTGAWVGSSDVKVVPSGRSLTAMGWEVEPQGLRDVLVRVSRDYETPPLYVTENGAAFDDVVSPDGLIHDAERLAYLRAHFKAAHQAISEGVDLRGYFVWSLLDNFEWALGYSKRFGLIYVDYETQRRIPKDSARWYAMVTRSNGLVHGGA